jgi:HD-like signal output (HDOD) protein
MQKCQPSSWHFCLLKYDLAIPSKHKIMTEVTQDHDKHGTDLKAQRFQMLEDIAKELAGEVVFPTHFDAMLHLRTALQDPNHSTNSIAKIISMDPLISAKVLHLANSVAFNPAGNSVKDLNAAISRIGINAVRSAALAIAMAQMLRAKGMEGFSEISAQLWEHSVRTAAAARILAKQASSLNPEEAMLAGLIHDLGAFYMLYRATQYEDLRDRPDSLRYLIINWHESIGVSLLDALGLPEEIVEASVDHDHPRPVPTPIRTYRDVVYIANMLAGGHFEWLMQEIPSDPSQISELEEKYAELLPEIEQLTSEMHGSFS